MKSMPFLGPSTREPSALDGNFPESRCTCVNRLIYFVEFLLIFDAVLLFGICFSDEAIVFVYAFLSIRNFVLHFSLCFEVEKRALSQFLFIFGNFFSSKVMDALRFLASALMSFKSFNFFLYIRYRA